jgi:hypothetical protein
MDDHDDLIFYVCICLDWMLGCAADHDIDNVVIETEVVKVDKVLLLLSRPPHSHG